MATLPGPQPTPRRLLLASNLTSRVDRALARAMLLARDWDAEVHVVHVVEVPPPAVPAGVDAGGYLALHPDPRLEASRRLRRDLGDDWPAGRIHVVDAATPAQAIIEVAGREACGLIVLGETRERLLDVREGTVDQVVRMAPMPVRVVRDVRWRRIGSAGGAGFHGRGTKALVPADGLFPTPRHPAARRHHAVCAAAGRYLGGARLDARAPGTADAAVQAHGLPTATPGRHVTAIVGPRALSWPLRHDHELD